MLQTVDKRLDSFPLLSQDCSVQEGTASSPGELVVLSGHGGFCASAPSLSSRDSQLKAHRREETVDQASAFHTLVHLGPSLISLSSRSFTEHIQRPLESASLLICVQWARPRGSCWGHQQVAWCHIKEPFPKRSEYYRT